ncbi:MAG: transcriptional regulator [Ferruginibacter sp.]|nr:transcriptional regulator [Ferruginibacter sp.]
MFKAGDMLMSTRKMDDPNFDQALLYLTEVNEEGVTGFIINKIFPRRFNELRDYTGSKALPLFSGGPVENDKLFFIHCRPDLVENAELIAAGIYHGGDFSQAVAAINSTEMKADQVKLLLGYCGWDAGELDAELAEGYWAIVNERPVNIFSDLENAWQQPFN